MAFVEPGTLFPDRNYLPDTPDVDIPFAEVVGAARRQYNVTSGLISLGLEDQGDGPVSDYEPWDDMGGYENYAWDLAEAVSPGHMTHMKSKIDQELKDRRTLDMSGWQGVVTSMAAGLIDPVMLPFMVIPFTGAGRIAGAAKTALQGAAVVGTEAAVSETLLHDQQATRTPLESYFNIGSSVLVGGVLGAAVGRLTKSQMNAAVKHTTEYFDDTVKLADEVTTDPVTGRSIGADAAENLTVEETELYASGARSRVAQLNTGGQMVTSASPLVRDLGMKLHENAFRFTGLTKNLKAVPQAVESKIKAWTEGAFSEVSHHTKQQYNAYRKRMKNSTESKLTLRQFRVASGKAAFSGSSDIPEAATAGAFANKRIYEPMLKRGMEVNSFGKEFDPATMGKYLNRVWNREKIAANEPELEAILFKWIRSDVKRGRISTMSDEEVYAEIHDTLQTLKGWNEGTLNWFDPKNAGKAGSMHERVLRIPDELIEDFLVRDLDHLTRVYTRSVGPRIELAHMSPDDDWNLTGMIDDAMADLAARRSVGAETTVAYTRRVTTEAGERAGDVERLALKLKEDQARLRRLRKPERIEALEKNIALQEDILAQQRAALAESEKLVKGAAQHVPLTAKELKRLTKEIGYQRPNAYALRDRLLGLYDLPRDPTLFLSRLPYYLKAANYVTMMGVMAVSSIPDLARPIYQFGLARSYGRLLTDFGSVTRNWSGGLDELRKAGTAWDIISASTARRIADLDEVPRFSRATERVEWLTNKFSLMTGISHWNTMLKGFTGLIGQDKMLRTAVDWAAGGGNARDIRDLLELGIDLPMAKRIAKQELNRDDSLWLANTDAWVDEEATRVFRAGLVKLADTGIITPGVGDMHRFIRGDTLKLLTQFKSFTMATVGRQVIPMTQAVKEGDARVYQGMVASLALGSATYFIKMKLAGREDQIPWDNEGQLVAEAIDRSGAAGPLMELYNLAERMTRGKVGAGMLTGDENRMMSRYGGNNSLLGLIGGPSVGMAETIGTAVGALSNPGDMTRADVRALMKMIPFRNLALLQATVGTQAMEDAAAAGVEALGADVK